jgi:hypothetical protein
MDRDSITGAFLNSDDTGLTTNVFLTEPRIYGLRVTKEWSGGPWWTGADPASHGPFPLTVELGGQVQKQDAPYETMAIDWANGVPAELDPRGVENRDLDWGDGRSLKLTWRPAGAPWFVSGAVRYGRTNGGRHDMRGEVETTQTLCALPSDSFFGYLLCNPASPYYDSYPQFHSLTTLEWSDGNARDREEHTIVDFTVGHDVGLGALTHSTLSAGLRQASFKSASTLYARAVVNWQAPDGWFVYDSSYTEGTVNLRANRKFDGAGPMASWDAAARLLGGDETGRLNLAWSIGAGALFGKQETRIEGQEQTVERQGQLKYAPLPAGEPTIIDRSGTRSQEVTVPVVDLSLGLSYEAGRISVGTGYRWERYFNVLDAGFTEHRSYDRTIDGPYFKVSLGFGG